MGFLQNRKKLRNFIAAAENDGLRAWLRRNYFPVRSDPIGTLEVYKAYEKDQKITVYHGYANGPELRK